MIVRPEMQSLARFSVATALARKPGVRSFASWQKKFPKFFKSSSVCVARDCRAQIEFVIAYRVRRGLQLLILYSKLGEEHALLRCFQTIKRHFVRFSQTSAVALSAAVIKFSWEEERIRDDEMVRHMNDLDLCHRLMKTFDLKAPLCKEHVPPTCPEEGFLKFIWSETCWHPFVNLDNLTIWKKQTSESASKTLACYKIYGHFDDVKALSFLQAYLDLETRKTWDQHVLKLEVVESEPATNSDLIYWISKWPRLFSNRDYVYKRRYMVDYKRQLISVVSKATKHPNYPPTKESWRVENYWSYLTVKPKKSFEENGLEFSLTYYDDPGSNLPSSMLIWATVHGMPNYFKQLHQETLKIDQRGGGSSGSLIDFKQSEQSPSPEVDPYEMYELDVDEEVEDKSQGSPDDVKPSETDRKVLGNVPFPLPPPSDPAKPPLLPRELSPEELNRSWKQVKSIVKESVDKVVEKYEDGSHGPTKPAESEKQPPCSGEAPQPVDSVNANPKASSMMRESYLRTFATKTSEIVSNHGVYGCDSDGTLLLTISDQTVVLEAVLRLKRIIFKILFDRSWR